MQNKNYDEKSNGMSTYLLNICFGFCRLEMYGRAYTWLLLGTYSNKWWMRRAPCSKRDLSAALDTTILTDLLPLSTTGEMTVSGIVSMSNDFGIADRGKL